MPVYTSGICQPRKFGFAYTACQPGSEDRGKCNQVEDTESEWHSKCPPPPPSPLIPSLPTSLPPSFSPPLLHCSLLHSLNHTLTRSLTHSHPLSSLFLLLSVYLYISRHPRPSLPLPLSTYVSSTCLPSYHRTSLRPSPPTPLSISHRPRPAGLPPAGRRPAGGGTVSRAEI